MLSDILLSQFTIMAHSRSEALSIGSSLSDSLTADEICDITRGRNFSVNSFLVLRIFVKDSEETVSIFRGRLSLESILRILF